MEKVTVDVTKANINMKKAKWSAIPEDQCFIITLGKYQTDLQYLLWARNIDHAIEKTHKWLEQNKKWFEDLGLDINTLSIDIVIGKQMVVK